MRPRTRLTAFHVDRFGNLVMRSVPLRGQPYQHTCRKESFEEIVYAMGEIARSERPVKLELLGAATNLPNTQCNVALQFLLDRGCLVTEQRMHFPALGNVRDGCVSLDGLIEYHAFAEGSPGSAQPDLPEFGE